MLCPQTVHLYRVDLGDLTLPAHRDRHVVLGPYLPVDGLDRVCPPLYGIWSRTGSSKQALYYVRSLDQRGVRSSNPARELGSGQDLAFLLAQEPSTLPYSRSLGSLHAGYSILTPALPTQ